ncbi:cysteine--tRNA ligase [Paeniglutamicibacter cryotolerans]|uniref:Cysteine--tRNA ligase n=1 Tax=Paeniglutamicibacter cryotolerans TaxID=670079 RepID=A0A839QMZ0_9MICC|nr:cysteine--tRNA ligase [Paeniglutamicibacter cryotolerans]MBB2995366.1 cysteinyl-tRNA synthetase [Paeniglutamicibacter cryotolerans]
MSIRFYDTKQAQIRDFVPLIEGEASLYYCGATVQGMPHVGHVRSAIAFDILTRWLEATGHAVTVVRNVTDIDDKILEKSAASYAEDFEEDEDYLAREPWFALAYRFEQEFAQAYDVLGVRRPTYEPRATGHIPEMHGLIAQLIERGHAYPALDDSGDVYFDVRSWKDYGTLTRQNIDDMQGATDADPRGKRDARDFALWKGYKATDPATASWPSPWGPGRPGWHLECSAMVTKYLGTEFDIHGGGLDLRFPHHENELAQSTAAGHGFANFWMHNGMVTYEGEKMSKSIGNTISPAQMLELATPRVVRYFLGQAHYRSQLDYRPASLAEAGSAVERIDTFIANALERIHQVSTGSDFDIDMHHFEVTEDFAAAMNEDLNVPQALAALHATVRAGNTALAAGDLEAADAALQQVMAMTYTLGLDDAGSGEAGSDAAEHRALDMLIHSQLAARDAARAAKDWAAADAIRDALAAAGIVVEDSAAGARWSLK